MFSQSSAALCLACLGALLAARSITAASLNTTAVLALNSTLSGYAIATAQDPGFDVAYETWNNLQQGINPVLPHSVPAVYVKAAGIPDVLVAIEFAIKNGLKTSFMANGHQFGDASLLSGGVTIDVLDLHDAAVYPENKTAYFQPGWNGGDFGNLTDPYSLYFPVTHASGVGLSGYTLGYGNGWGTNLVGAAVDNVLAFDVVNTWDYNTTGKLEVVTVDANSYPDLFWGLRGAGQNLAAVVGFHVQLHDLPPHNLIAAVETIFPLPLAFKAYAEWLEWKETAPFTLEATIVMTASGPGEYGVLFAVFNWDPTGEDTASAAALEDWAARANRTGAIVVMQDSIPWSAVLTSQDKSQDFPGNSGYIYAPFTELGAITMDVFSGMLLLNSNQWSHYNLVMHYANVSGPNSIILISDTTENVGISNTDTAFGFRNQTNVWVWSMWARTEGGAVVDGDAANIAWVEESRQLLEPIATGQYINMVMWSSPNDTQNSYPPENWARIKELKAKYDSRNLFRDLYYWRPKVSSNSVDFSQQDVDGAVTF